MAQRKRRPVEPLELHWEKTEDLKELMRGYFPHAKVPETAPPGETPTGVIPDGVPPIETSDPLPLITVTPTGVPPVGAAPTGGVARTAAPEPPTGPPPAGKEPIPLPPIPKTPVGVIPVGISPVGVSPVRIARPHRCAAAHDAHTHSEEAVYQFLWRLGLPAESLDFRYSSISLKHLSERVRMDAKSTQALLRRLVDKLSIELAAERDNHRQTARIWKVYSPAAILDRRRRAGLEWIVRNKGIHFVPPPEDPPAGETPIGDPLLEVETPVGVFRP